MFSRHTEPGMSVVPIQSSHPNTVQAVKVDNTIFFVNQNQADTPVALGIPALGNAHIYTEDTLFGDTESGYDLPITGETITLPAMSFGYIQ
jgi:hypothetical protein